MAGYTVGRTRFLVGSTDVYVGGLGINRKQRVRDYMGQQENVVLDTSEKSQRSSFLRTGVRTAEIAKAGFFNLWTALSHWYTLVRIETKAELYAGLAKVILEVLELEHLPVVRQRVSEIVQFAQIIQGICIASMETATLSEGGLLMPGATASAAGRIYAMEALPRILHLLRDLCGQGLILRFHKSDFSKPAAFGQKFEWFLDTQRVSASHKNALMNLVWDVAASEHATRSLIFESQHDLSEPLLRDRMVLDHDYSHQTNFIRNYIGLAPRATNV